MLFYETKIPGVFEIHIEPHPDDRGFFARSWCQKEFEAHGLDPRLVQCNIAFNMRKGTLRGMHFQAPHAEAKLVRCTRGAIYDVVLDLRPSSPTYKDWIAFVLTSANRHMVYVPEGCAHGLLTLEHETEVFYQMSEFYDAESSCGVRWDDPAFQITWPGRVEVISQRDVAYPAFEMSL
jgi:dTDP-4-dehydrorhamnose 3,5-epimerase